MGAAKACLGYPSRTAAILAMRANGMATGEIARRIGIPTKTVSALEASLWRGNLRPVAPKSPTHQQPARQQPPRQQPAHRSGDAWQAYLPIDQQCVRVDQETLAKLRRAASVRGLPVAALIEQLFIVMTDDDLIDALLDDRQ